MASNVTEFTGRDLLSRLESDAGDEQVVRVLADNAPIMLWVTSADGSATYFNRRWIDFTGQDVSTSLGDAWVEYVHPQDRERVVRTVNEALERRSRLEMKFRLRRADGQHRYVLSVAEPLHDSEGRFTGFVGCTFDITKQAEDEKALWHTNVALESRSRDMTLLSDLNDNLQVCKTIDETKPILRKFGRQLFPDHSVTLSLFNESRNMVEPFVSWGDDPRIESVFAPDDCWAMRKSKPHLEMADEGEAICPNFASCRAARYLCAPMIAYGEVIGSLHLVLDRHADAEELEEARALMNRARPLALMAADQIALALANLKLRATLQYHSTRDPLTQLYNRRYLLETLDREVSRADRSGQPMSVLVIDIDHFKRFNDTYGHDAGDQLLREFGIMLRQVVRGSDIACRYGGEEFVVVLTDAPAAGAMQRAEAIRELTARLAVEYHGQMLDHVTISIGVSERPSHGQSIEQLLRAGDAALYQAKADGRNCVVLAPTRQTAEGHDSAK